MKSSTARLASLLYALPLLAAGHSWAAVPAPQKILNVDLAPKIEASLAQRERFAVDVPHVAGVASAGSWERASGVSTWRYSVSIPSAVSLSFHAGEYLLPRGAQLKVSGVDGQAVMYSGAEGGPRGLWSRLARGNGLWFELSVPTAAEADVRFSIASLQAGYRGLGGGASDHPHYRKLRDAAQALSLAPCDENFACHSTAANSLNGDATAAVVVGGVALCSATLVNNLRNDGTAYLLTARHCQDTPDSGVVVYWNAMKVCGSPLATIYDTSSPAYLSSTDTVFEQQDVWLLRLNSPLTGARTYFAGWDASGGSFVGGYSPHHAQGASRQYAEWFGQAALVNIPGSVLGLGYDSNFWGVVNSIGRVGSGASGGGLFNAEHRLVGVASLAYVDSAGLGQCPAASPVAPNEATATALYSALSAVWESNADTTSFTNPVTLKSLLDPDGTGQRVANGYEMLAGLNLTANGSHAGTGSAVTLNWTMDGSPTCTASGGSAGDGWAGPRPLIGSFHVTQQTPGTTTYTLRCQDGSRFTARSVIVTWVDTPATLFLNAMQLGPTLGATVDISWTSNVEPCVATGGSPGDGWAGNKARLGPQSVPLLQAGLTTYTLTCGTGLRQIARTVQVTANPPSASLEALSNNMRVGSEVVIMQSGAGSTCVRSGGVAGSGWAGSESAGVFRVTSANAGTFRFTLTCNGGPTPAVAHLDLTFTNAAPAATLTPNKTTAQVLTGSGSLEGDSPFAIDFAWQSNVAPCQLSYDGPGSEDGNANPSMDMPGAGSHLGVQTLAGTYVYTITCVNGADVATASTTVDFVPLLPYVSLQHSTRLAANEAFELYWRANVSPCVASGGAGGDGWAGALAGTDGVKAVTISTPGTYLYTVTCGSGGSTASTSRSVTIAAPAVSFTPHAAQVLTGNGFVLEWSSTVAPCFKEDAWAMSIPHASYHSAVNVIGTPGVYTFSVRCGSVPNQVSASTQVTVMARPVVSIAASATSLAVNQPVTLSWTSQNTTSCQATSPALGEWSGVLPTSGSRSITSAAPGSQGFYIQCDGVTAAVVVEWTSVVFSAPKPSPPALTFTIDHTQRLTGEAVTLTWTTQRSAVCRGTQGVNGDGWVGVLPVSGSRSITITGTGTFTWGLSCSGAPPAASAQVSATYTVPTPPPAPPPTPPASGGGGSSGGGGGSLDGLFLGALLAGLMFGFAARRRKAR